MLGIGAGLAFALAYGVAMAEERLRVRKSVPMLLAAGVVWILVGIANAIDGRGASTAESARRTLLDFAELLLFLIPAMTFVNTLEERGLFDVLQQWLAAARLSLRSIFWVTGGVAFAVSPIADNLTTAVLLGGVVMAVGRTNPVFVKLACINVVVAANAGGTFSPFGDITTLMVWQAGRLGLTDFAVLFWPALVNWLVPAALLSLHVRGHLPAVVVAPPKLEPGAFPVLLLFLATIALTVTTHTLLDLPPALGMMAGLALLKGYGVFFNVRHRLPKPVDELDQVFARPDSDADAYSPVRPLDVFALLEKIEWDTLMFFYGVLLCVGGLGAFGYLTLLSQVLYGGANPTMANTAIGIVSAFVDNVPVMFAVLNMNPAQSTGQWLLVTLTAGVGGSLLSIGSAAGVALMGQARGVYTFAAHLRWTWAIALGYAASIAVHLVLNVH